MMSKFLRLGSASLLAVAVFCSPAAAEPALYLSVGDTFGGFSSTSTFQGYVPGTVIDLSGTVTDPQYVLASGRTARADYGTLGVGVAAFLHVIDNPYNQLGFNIRPEAQAISLDRVTVAGGTVGAPVTMYVDALVHVTSRPWLSPLYSDQYPSLPNGVSSPSSLPRKVGASLTIDGFGSLGYSSDGGCSLCINVPDPLAFGDAITFHRFSKVVAVGDSVEVNATFGVAAQVFYNFQISGVLMGSAAFNGLGTAQLGISFSDPNVYAIADSGHVYSLPAVPEPSSWALLIAGFGVVGTAQRRHRVGARTV